MLSRRNIDGPRSFTIFVLVAAVVAIILTHGPLLGYKAYVNVDEAYSMAIAERLLEGHKLYVGAVSQRGPLMYYTFELIAWLHGWDNVVAIRIYALLLAVAHVLVVYYVGKKLVSRSAGTIAAGVSGYALAFGFPPTDAAALHGEVLQLPALMIAVLLGGLAVYDAPGSRQRRLALAVAGFAFGLAISIKQSVALHPLPVVLWLAIDAHRRRAFRTAFWDTMILTATTLIVPIVCILHSAGEGTLSQLYYYCVEYNSKVHMRPTTKRLEWLPLFFLTLTSQTGFTLTTFALVGRGLPFIVRRVRSARAQRSLAALGRGFGAREYLALHFVLALFAACVMWRFFPHYFVQALPFLSLCIGIAVDKWFRQARTAAAARGVFDAFMFFVLLCGSLGCVFGERVDGRVGHDRTVQDVSRYITATTKPDDRIFVWGFSSWIYEYSHRRPAGRYVFETYVTGFVPWFWEKLEVEKARIVPGSVEALMGDLEREHPEVVVDAGSVMMARPMRMYETWNTWLHKEFCFEVRVGAYDVYRRKVGGAACSVPYFPRVSPPQDWNGRPMAIPLPKTLDWDTSPRLPIGNYLKPIWFTNGSSPPAAGLEALRDKKREKEEREGQAEGFAIFDLEPNSVVLPPTTMPAQMPETVPNPTTPLSPPP